MNVRRFRPADLTSLAVDSMWQALFDLPSGDALDGSVYVFFDVSQPPGREFAASALAHEEGMDRERALAFVEATADAAMARGDAVGVGAFFTVADLVTVLARYVLDEGSRVELARLATWLAKPIPLGTCRLVIVAGTELRASLARVGHAAPTQAPAPMMN